MTKGGLILSCVILYEIEIGTVKRCAVEREICDVWWENGFRRERRGCWKPQALLVDSVGGRADLGEGSRVWSMMDPA